MFPFAHDFFFFFISQCSHETHQWMHDLLNEGTSSCDTSCVENLRQFSIGERKPRICLTNFNRNLLRLIFPSQAVLISFPEGVFRVFPLNDRDRHLESPQIDSNKRQLRTKKHSYASDDEINVAFYDSRIISLLEAATNQDGFPSDVVPRCENETPNGVRVSDDAHASPSSY